MLRRRRRVAFLALACLAAGARGQDDQVDGVRRPERITVGVGDQYLGQLSPDGRTLYFVSNRNTVNEIFEQDVDEGRVRLLFDEGADVSWPRLSPDGRALLYISFRDRAEGELCIRALPQASERRCLGDGSVALQAEWIDRERIAVVTRSSIQGDLSVSEVKVGAELTTRELLHRSVIGPTVSPDGRWLVYVPVERYVPQVGPAFAARAARHLEAMRLDRPGPTAPIQLDLPGVTGQPAFSRDGRYLYVVQFLDDSNHDGVIDANDHGVLFRLPFRPGQDDAPALASAANPEQLTQSSWNCQYPSPALERLIATCSREQSLDVYGLPLEGVIPNGWDAERIALEIDLAATRAEELLLYRRRLAISDSVPERASAMMRLVLLHLEAEEFATAEFYARGIASLPDPAVAQLSKALLLLTEHRQALADRERGRSVAGFLEAARRRMELLRPEAGDGPATVVLRHVVLSEVADSIGDKATARSELAAAELGDETPAAVSAAYYGRADALYRELDDREALVAAVRRLATAKTLTAEERCRYARAAARALYRGRPFAEADAVLARERRGLPDDSEMAFGLELARAVLAIHEAHPPPVVGDELVALYRRQTRPDRRRALMVDAVRRSNEFGADEVIERLAEEYVRDVKPGTMERRRAERLYARAIVGRAFRRRAEGRLAEAREDFEAVTRATGSLETAVSSIELRLRMGESPAALAAEEERQIVGPWKPMDHFVKAYLLARTLPQLDEKAHAATAAEATAQLRACWKDLKQNHVAQALFGAIWHEDYLRSGSLASAERANVHFIVALELVQNNPRYRAMILGQLGLLHTEVGNYRIALRYLEDREKLPFAENASGLAVRLAKARSLLHVDRESDAAAAADEALAMVEESKTLSPYRGLALDCGALYNLAAGHFQRALAIYDAEMPLLEKAQGPAGAHNRLTAHLARAAAALGAGQPGRALQDLDFVDTNLKDPLVAASLQWPHASPEHVLRSYRLLAAGLRANAAQELGLLDAAAVALSERRQLFVDQLGQSNRDEHLRALTLVETRLADNAAEREDLASAARWIGQALGHADSLADRAHAAIDPGQLTVLWVAAELGACAHAPLSFDLSSRLSRAQTLIGERRDAVWRGYQRWFEIYLTLLAPAPAP